MIGSRAKDNNNDKSEEEVVACLQFSKTLKQPKNTEVVAIAKSSDSIGVDRVTATESDNKKEQGINKKDTGDETQKKEQH